MNKVYCYPRCTTCKKAVKWLEENGIEYEYKHIVEETPSKEEIKKYYEKSGLPLKKFFNTSGNVYKQMNLKEKLAEMSEDEQFELLASNGMVLKRPLFVGKDFVLVGFKEAEWAEKLK
ncbi:arsenate reductase family protein [Leptotrichia wadei]|uniref:Arsenate reductase n=1 Tax=Leptotrichia wadei TaxID=157687 RepID=A0A510KTB1_9FUSO|nr:arsenate reductase family protein [Leptotrichia wadei]BBM54978.1 arsenate reductase [Leptotrichia wadei]VTX49469.1 Regulatory protein MgsR [uncultured Leptotrichia sp.]